jgi:G3E family GTPase
MSRPRSAAVTPVTLLTGWLGAGKTTLLNRILRGDHGRRYAVLVNEFGQVGIDDRLVKRRDEDLVELSNGCVCCTVRGDLVRALKRLKERRLGILPPRRFDHVVVETTGVAEPAPLLRTFLMEDDVASAYEVQAVLTLADAAHLDAALAERSAAEQVALADLLLLNKVDLVDEAQLAARETALRRLNPVAPIRRCTEADLPLDELLRPRREDFAVEDLPPATATDHADGHGPAHDIVSIHLADPRALDELKTRLWLDACVQQLGERLVRYKGFLHLEDRPYRCVLQGVYELYSVEPGEPWAAEEPRANELVFLGHGLDEDFFRRGLDAATATTATT